MNILTSLHQNCYRTKIVNPPNDVEEKLILAYTNVAPWGNATIELESIRCNDGIPMGNVKIFEP